MRWPYWRSPMQRFIRGLPRDLTEACTQGLFSVLVYLDGLANLHYVDVTIYFFYP